MLSNVISTGKEIANKLTNKILNLSDVEAKIKEATNDDNWGPSSSMMREIAEETFSTTNFHDVMTFLWYRIFSEKPANSRRVHKGLVLLAYLIVNGSELVAISCKAHLSHISKLRYFNDQSGTADVLVRKKAADICELLGDAERLTEERKRAMCVRSRNTRADTEPGRGTSDSWKTGRAQSLGDIEDWQPSSRSIPFSIGESFMNFVNTFTQNISGPPPTETHDNFELPSMDGEYDDSNLGKSTYDDSQSYVKPIDQLPKGKCKVVKAVDRAIVNTEAIKVVQSTEIHDAPIIDFTEPAPDVNNNTKESCSPILDAMDFEDDFGRLRGWNDGIDFGPMGPASAEPMKPAAPPVGSPWSKGPDLTDFSADFDALSHRGDVMSPPVMVPPKHSAQMMPAAGSSQSESKVGATWSELDKLNIDLNNLCGGRKRAFSKT